MQTTLEKPFHRNTFYILLPLKLLLVKREIDCVTWDFLKQCKTFKLSALQTCNKGFFIFVQIFTFWWSKNHFAQNQWTNESSKFQSFLCRRSCPRHLDPVSYIALVQLLDRADDATGLIGFSLIVQHLSHSLSVSVIQAAVPVLQGCLQLSYSGITCDF